MKYIDYGKFKRNGEIVKAKNCELCDRPAILIHHKDFGNDNHNIGNLQPLCRYCHLRLHREQKERTRKKLALPVTPLTLKLCGFKQ